MLAGIIGQPFHSLVWLGFEARLAKDWELWKLALN